MKTYFFVSKSIALSVKLPGTGPYGRGFNCLVQVGVPMGERDKLLRVWEEVLGRIDHRALGVDIALDVEMGRVHLLSHLRQQFQAALNVHDVQVSMEWGDGIRVCAP